MYAQRLSRMSDQTSTSSRSICSSRCINGYMTGGLFGLLSGLACDCPGQCIILGRELIVCPIDCGDAVTDLFLIIVGPLHLVILLGAGLLTGPIRSEERRV